MLTIVKDLLSAIFKRHFHVKIIANLIPIDLVKNWILSFLLLFFFFSNQKQKSIFCEVGCLITINIFQIQ